jgi:hypothetical protein
VEVCKVSLRECIENGMLDNATIVRDTETPSAPHLTGMYPSHPDVVQRSAAASSNSQGHSAVMMSALHTSKGVLDLRRASAHGQIGARNQLHGFGTNAAHNQESGDSSDGDEDAISLVDFGEEATIETGDAAEEAAC